MRALLALLLLALAIRAIVGKLYLELYISARSVTSSLEIIGDSVGVLTPIAVETRSASVLPGEALLIERDDSEAAVGLLA